MRYGIVGWYGHQNVGDEILLKSALERFGKRQAIVFTTDLSAADTVKEVHDVEAFDMKSIPEHDLDFLMFAGGDVFHNLTVEWYFPKSMMEKIRFPILMLSVGVPFGEGRTALSKSIDYFVKRLDFISFRCAYSQKIFSDLWKKRSFLLPDLAFSIKKQSIKKKEQIALQVRKVPKSYHPITPQNFDKIACRQFAELTSKFHEMKIPFRILVFEPHKLLIDNYENEYIECFNDISLTIKEISSSAALIGTRLHACIIALTQNTPIKAYRYQGKIESVIGMLCNRERIIYPKGVLPFDRFYPIAELSPIERKNVDVIQQYLERSLDIIGKAAVNNDLKDLSLPKFPLSLSVHDTFNFSRLRHKPKFLRDIRAWFSYAIGRKRRF